MMLWADQGILVAVHLHVDAGKLPPGAVVVDDEVVNASTLSYDSTRSRMRVHQLRVGGGAQQGIDGVLGNADAAPEDEDGHGQTGIAIDVQIGEPAHHKPASSTAAVVMTSLRAVGGGGLQGGGVDGPCPTAC